MSTIKTFQVGFLGGQSTLKITSGFGKRVMDGKIETHNGLDLSAATGTKIYAPEDGAITTGYNKSEGRFIKLRYKVDSNLFFDIIFMHLTSINVLNGSKVSSGTLIGTTGGAVSDPNRGYSKGQHLHLQINKNGSLPVDPLYYFLARNTVVDIRSKIPITVYNANPLLLYFQDNSLVTLPKVKTPASKNTVIANQTESKNAPVDITPQKGKSTLAPGIWSIVKLLTDKSVENRQVYDSGISVQTGSIVNFFRKVCQEPLVEFMGDTIGDQYFFIMRKPPFDKESINRMLNLGILEINDKDIFNQSLSWNEDGIYSWYQYIPMGDTVNDQINQMFIPAIFFPEYACIWGSKPLSVQSNYFDFTASGVFDSVTNSKSSTDANSDRIIRNAVRDFKYLIESNAYSPFCRKGTITINGDRRFKRGTWILYNRTGEIFHVDSVNNSASFGMDHVSRTTTLNVSHGIYKNFVINSAVINGKSVNYFNIIDFGDFDLNKVTAKNYQDIISKWKVDLDSFGFFMRKQQVFWEKIL